MHYSKYIRRIMVIVFICISLFYIVTIYVINNGLVNTIDKKNIATDNNAWLLVNQIMAYIEQNSEIINSDKEVRNVIVKLCEQQKVSLLVVDLDGDVIFQHGLSSTVEQIDLKYDLVYNKYNTKTEKNIHQVAYPIIDAFTHRQSGNAVFFIPSYLVELNSERQKMYVVAIISSILYILSLIIIYSLLRKNISKVVRPINNLENHIRFTLKGHYDDKLEDSEFIEMNALNGTFKEMRKYIKYLHARQSKQLIEQKELIGGISHDIRTPLSAIKAYSEAMQEGICKDLDTAMPYIQIIHSNANKIIKLVEDLFYHSLKELGKISIAPKQLYSGAILKEIITPLSIYVRSKKISFNIKGDIPNVLINVDVQRLDQVLANLISNAVKHTSEGDTITFSSEIENESLVISIADTGTGILPEDMPFIFEKYYKGNNSQKHRNSNEDGAGLGLSICKYIVEEHGGSIYFKSNKDIGTKFYFKIPLC